MGALIERPGSYTVRSFKGNVFEIDIIDRDGELGAWFDMTRNFVNIKEFVKVEVLNYDRQ